MTSTDGAGLPVALLVAVLLMIGVAGIGIAAGPDVVSPDLDARAAQQEVTVPEEEPEQGEASLNESYLREALGSEFEIEGDELVANDLDGLPAELVAHASVVVVPSEDDELACVDDAESVTCEDRTLPGRGDVQLQTFAARHSAAGSNFGQVTVRHLRSNGHVVVVQLFVLGRPAEGSTTELEEDVRAWLAAQEDALISAALDDRMRADPA